MKFAARDGSAARTLAFTKLPSTRRQLRPVPAASWSGDRRDREAAPMSTALSPVGDSTGTRSVRLGHRGSPSTTSFARGETIFTPGEGEGMVYIVRTGCIRLYKVLPDRRSINLGLLGPNTVFTQEDTVEGIASGAIAEALVDSVVAVVATDSLGGIIAEAPELAAAMVTGMSRRLTELQTLVEHLLVRDTAVRLATTLIALAHRFGRPTADGMTAIALPLTHQSLAGMIGSNRVTVTRKLLELQEGGYVRSLGRNALAVNPERLRAYAHPGDPVDKKDGEAW
jgi:CRP/FNR family transcriptional regulator